MNTDATDERTTGENTWIVRVNMGRVSGNESEGV